jgi:DNA-binding IclR family transcriptional regulator
MGNREAILAFLQSIAPNTATNSEIVSRTGIRPHTQVFQITRDLMRNGLIKGRQFGGHFG